MSNECDELRAEMQRLAERVAVLEQEKGTLWRGVVPVDMPEWAEWIAMDENGSWYAYDKRPICKEESGYFWGCGDMCYWLENYTPPHPPHDWRESLRRIR